MRRRTRRWWPAVPAALLLAVAGTALAVAPRPSAQVAVTKVTKVLWIMEENSNPDQILGTCATCSELPYLNMLATTYGRATNVRAASVPSLPNYLAATSGSTYGIADDLGPSAHPLSGPSLFSQLPGGQAMVFAESMTKNCQLTSSPASDVNGAGFYVVRHTGWPYYTDARADCLKYQVPMEGNLQAAIDGGLPAFSAVVPANCNNFHKGGDPDVCQFAPGQTYYSRADAWLAKTIQTIMAGPDWQAGRLAIFIVWDEGRGAAPTKGADCTTSTKNACRIPLVVVSPGTLGIVDPTPYTTYSILRTTEELLGLPLLGRAATATSMLPGFGLGGNPPPPTSTTTTPTTPTTTAGTDTTPPTGSITSPTSGAVLSGAAPVAVSASDNVGVSEVRLLVDGTWYATDRSAPYTFSLTTTAFANGSHTLTSKIVDGAGNRTVTAPVAVTVAN